MASKDASTAPDADISSRRIVYVCLSMQIRRVKVALTRCGADRRQLERAPKRSVGLGRLYSILIVVCCIAGVGGLRFPSGNDRLRGPETRRLWKTLMGHVSYS